jgi:hypothetical protein
VTEQILATLRERTAFKPKPPDYELALAHVPLGDVGLSNPIEERVLAAMRTEDESFVLVLAPPGGGKSSLLAWAAWQAVTSEALPRILPVYVPVGHHTATIDPSLIVRGVAEDLAVRLAPTLKKQQRETLERALSITFTTARQPSRLRVGLSAPPQQAVAASLQFRELRDRAARVLNVPSPGSHEQARALVRGVLEQRIRIVLDEPAPHGGWCDVVFSSDAIELLARRCLERTLRQALADVRDTFDHHEVLPAQITRDHLIEAISA